MTITTEQKLKAACAILRAWDKYSPGVNELSVFGRELAIDMLSTAAKEIEKLTGVMSVLQEIADDYYALDNGCVAVRVQEALARFKELVGC